MKNNMLIAAISLIAVSLIPAQALAEMTASAPAKELTLADFRNTAQKPVSAWEQYRKYKNEKLNPMPQATLDVSRIRTVEMRSEQLIKTAPKAIVTAERRRQQRWNETHAAHIPKDNYYGGYEKATSGKPAVDLAR
jgi:hypothetical protein